MQELVVSNQGHIAITGNACLPAMTQEQINKIVFDITGCGAIVGEAHRLAVAVQDAIFGDGEVA